MAPQICWWEQKRGTVYLCSKRLRRGQPRETDIGSSTGDSYRTRRVWSQKKNGVKYSRSRSVFGGSAAGCCKTCPFVQGQVASARIGWRRPEDIKCVHAVKTLEQNIDQHLPWTLIRLTTPEMFPPPVQMTPFILSTPSPLLFCNRGQKGGISPDDVHQGIFLFIDAGSSVHIAHMCSGKLGDCWFLSVLSVLASKPQLVRNILISNNDEVISIQSSVPMSQPFVGQVKTGQYIVRIAECGYWSTVQVDDLLPA